jgi:hypothetical protein
MSTGSHTPTTSQIEDGYVAGRLGLKQLLPGSFDFRADFSNWLATHDLEIAERVAGSLDFREQAARNANGLLLDAQQSMRAELEDAGRKLALIRQACAPRGKAGGAPMLSSTKLLAILDGESDHYEENES